MQCIDLQGEIGRRDSRHFIMNSLFFLSIALLLIRNDLWVHSNNALFVKTCKHGSFLLSKHDLHVSKHLEVYGEWAEQELQLFFSIIKPGDVVLDVGANIGAFTVPLARAVGPTGRIHAFEPQRVIYQRLTANVAINGLYNVHTYLSAVGNHTSTINVPSIDYSYDANFAAISLLDVSFGSSFETVPVFALDEIDFTNKDSATRNNCPSLVKIDVELMERYVLQGARSLVNRCKPILYVENPCVMTSPPLVSLIYELGILNPLITRKYFRE